MCWHQWRGPGGPSLIELAELDPLAADIAPDVLLICEEPAEPVAIEVCSHVGGSMRCAQNARICSASTAATVSPIARVSSRWIAC